MVRHGGRGGKIKESRINICNCPSGDAREYKSASPLPPPSRGPHRVQEESMNESVVIVGGGAAGPSVAAEARRRDPSLRITMVERGDFVSYAA
jgi:NADPH-dependent 2,4-dienoyl-CoA reductase/sulfur reductase-like enzyme